MDKKQEYEAMKEKTLVSKEVFKGVVLDVFDDEIKLPNGKKSHREVIRHCQAAAILAINEKGEVLLEDQYRYKLWRKTHRLARGMKDAFLCKTACPLLGICID